MCSRCRKGQDSKAPFWSTAFGWSLRHIVLLAFVSYFSGAVFIVGCRGVQIYGPDPLRLRLADLVSARPSFYQVAGALLDYKKALVFVTCVLLLVIFRALVRYELGDYYPLSFPSRLRALCGWQNDWIGWLMVGTILLAVGMYAKAFLFPALSSHVFGANGAGLISQYTRSMPVWEHISLVAYRLSYLPFYGLLFILSALAFPAYIRLILRAPGPGGTFSQPSQTETLTLVLQLFGIPAVGLVGLYVLWYMTNYFGVGQLQGAALMTGVVMGAVLLCWTAVAGRWLIRDQVEAKHPVRRWAEMLGRGNTLFVLTSSGLLATGAAIIINQAARAPVDTTDRLRAVVLNRVTEYCGWSIDRAATVRSRAERTADSIRAEYAGDDRAQKAYEVLAGERSKQANRETLSELLACRLMTYWLLDAAFGADRRLQTDIRKIRRDWRQGSGRELYPPDMSPGELQDVTSSMVPLADKTYAGSWLFDPTALDALRPTILWRLGKDLAGNQFTNKKLTLLKPEDNTSDAAKIYDAIERAREAPPTEVLVALGPTAPLPR